MARKTIFKSPFLSVSFKNPFSEVLKSASERRLETEANKVIKNEILRLINNGLSPVKGYRALAKYKDPKKYPAGKKQSNKANLYLSGEMLSSYKAKAFKDYNKLAISVGIHDDETVRNQTLAKVHNTGSNPHIARRPFVPLQSRGETFTARINAAIRRIFRDTIRNALRKGRGVK